MMCVLYFKDLNPFLARSSGDPTGSGLQLHILSRTLEVRFLREAEVVKLPASSANVRCVREIDR